MRIEFSRWVESDLDSIAEYIAEDNPQRAVTFIREIRQKIRQSGRSLGCINFAPKSARTHELP